MLRRRRCQLPGAPRPQDRGESATTHPLDPLPKRSDATDEVFLEGLRFYAYHGVNPEERAQGQRFLVDVRLAGDLREAGRTDDLARTINYSAAYKRVRAIVEGEPRNLIEAVAEEIAAALLAELPLAQAVTVTVRKPEVALKGAILDAAGVRIHRTRPRTEDLAR